MTVFVSWNIISIYCIRAKHLLDSISNTWEDFTWRKLLPAAIYGLNENRVYSLINPKYKIYKLIMYEVDTRTTVELIRVTNVRLTIVLYYLLL